MREERDGSGCWGTGTLQPQPVARPVWLNGMGNPGQGSIPAAPQHLCPPLPSSPSWHQAQLSRQTPMEKLAWRSSPHRDPAPIRVQGHGAGTQSWDTNSSLHLPGVPSLAETISPFGRGCRETKANLTQTTPTRQRQAQVLPEHFRLWGSTSNGLGKNKNQVKNPKATS